MVTKSQALVLAFALVSSTATADPSPEIRRLMNEPVSMLDWGLNILREDLQSTLNGRSKELGIGPSEYVVGTDYDWNKNLIEISLSPNLVHHAAAKELCRNLLVAIRQTLVIRGEPGSKPVNLWVSYFQHSGWTTNSKTDQEVADKLPSIVVVDVSVWSSTNLIRCSGELLGDTVTYEEKTK